MEEIYRFAQELNKYGNKGVRQKEELLNEIEKHLQYVGKIPGTKNVENGLLELKNMIIETEDNEKYIQILKSYNICIRQDVNEVWTMQHCKIEKFRKDIITLKTKGVSYKDLLMHKLDLLVKDLNEVGGFEILVGRLHQMKEHICKQMDNEKYIKFLQTYHSFIESDDMETKHNRQILHLEQLVRQMEHQVLDISIPVVRPSVFDTLRENYASLREDLSLHKDDCHAIATLRQAADDIGEKIDYLVEDNKICLSWMGVGTALTGASIGIAFIPVVGLPIAAGVGASPYIGKLIHRLVVSSKRKKRFNQEKKTDSKK